MHSRLVLDSCHRRSQLIATAALVATLAAIAAAAADFAAMFSLK